MAITVYDYGKQPVISIPFKDQYNATGTLIRNERFKEVRRKLFGVSCLHDAEHCVTALLYDPHATTMYRPGLDTLEKLADYPDDVAMWSAIKRLYDTKPAQGGIEYPTIVGALLQDIDATKKLCEDWETISYALASSAVNNAACRYQLIKYVSPGPSMVHVDDEYAPPLTVESLRRGIDAMVEAQIAVPETFHVVEEGDLPAITLPDFDSTSLATRGDLIADLTANLNNLTMGSHFNVNPYRDVYCIRYDYKGPKGDEEPQFFAYCFLSLFYERIGWILREGSSTDPDTIAANSKLKRRIGGRIGATRSPMKNLEELSKT